MTGTTQPDPQVVACPDCDAPAGELCRNDRGAAVAWIHLGRRDRALEPQPLTVADIPAGQGPASLYVGPGHRGELAVYYRTGLDHDHVFMTEGRDDPTEARRAMWDHLAATLPHVTTGEGA